MHALRTRTLQPHLGALLPAARMAASVHPYPTNRFGSIQTRSVAAVPGKNPDNMGGPGGQEHFPESAALRRMYTITTMLGVIAACSVLVAAKVARINTDPNTKYVLVHDSSKGELDDVKFIKASDLPKS